jgi:hypothetical protein
MIAQPPTCSPADAAALQRTGLRREELEYGVSKELDEEATGTLEELEYTISELDDKSAGSAKELDDKFVGSSEELEFTTFELDEPYAIKTFGSSDDPEILLSEHPNVASRNAPTQAI